MYFRNNGDSFIVSIGMKIIYEKCYFFSCLIVDGLFFGIYIYIVCIL